MIEARNVVLAHGGRRVCEIASMRVLAGERLGIAGRSGAGKSTLLNVCAGLMRPSAGYWVNTFSRPAIMFQQPTLLPWRNALDNLTIPLQAGGRDKTSAHACAEYWLHRVGLADHAGAWPAALSGGQAQRLALARALSFEPDLLLLDEPFSALDSALRSEMLRHCVDWLDNSGAALICISHQPDELANLAPRCLLLENQKSDWLQDDQPHLLAARIHRALREPSNREFLSGSSLEEAL